MRRSAKKSSTRRTAILLLVIVLAVTAIGFAMLHWHSLRLPSSGAGSEQHVDTAVEGHKLTVSGKLEISQPPHDAQFGIAADAAVLLREVSMYQWQERCVGGNCRYETGWSGRAIDARKFHDPQGHENPTLPFADARFVAGEIRLGALLVDADLVATQLAAVNYPVHANALPPNLAATFREIDGSLYAGGDPARPSVGELRVTYRIVPTGAVNLSGVQRGAKLSAN